MISVKEARKLTEFALINRSLPYTGFQALVDWVSNKITEAANNGNSSVELDLTDNSINYIVEGCSNNRLPNQFRADIIALFLEEKFKIILDRSNNFYFHISW